MTVEESSPPNARSTAVLVGKATKPFNAAAAAAAAAAAGAAAAGVVERAHPGRLSRLERWHLEREAFRVKLHQHVRRELDRKLARGTG